MYVLGKGVLQDDQTAAKWYTLAAEQGLASAQYNLGVMYRTRDGVLQDDQAAMKWYTLAAEQGHANAQYSLGVAYDSGKGVSRNSKYAHMWFHIAASLGDESAKKNRQMVEEDMTSADVSAAKALAEECFAKDFKGC